MDEETIAKLSLLDATKGPEDVAPVEHIEYEEDEAHGDSE